jgi:ABC-2 type transport system permease protein
MIRKVWAVFQKDVKSLVSSPAAGLMMMVSVGIFNLFFFLLVEQNGEATLRDIFKVMEFLLIFIVPILTMKMFAEERSMGTFELLMTSPLSKTVLMLGKFSAAFFVYASIVFMTFPYYVILELYSEPDVSATLVGYFGLLMEGGIFIAIGMAMSALTRSQVVAAITSYVILLMLYFSSGFMKFLSGTTAQIVRYAGIWSHAENWQVGILETADVVYSVSLIVFFFVVTGVALARR